MAQIRNKKSLARKIAFLVFIIVPLATAAFLLLDRNMQQPQSPVSTLQTAQMAAAVSPAPTLAVTMPPIPSSKLMANDYQIYQTFNNCGPASLSMGLSYFGIHKTQAELGQDLRPYQNPQGDNDDKSVSLDELAQEAEKFGLVAYSRPNGSMQLLKELVAQNFPVIIETNLTKDDDIGHYRVVKGYDDAAGVIIQDDSMQGHNLRFSYADLDSIWKQYDYAYVVLVPKDKQQIAEAILGRNLDLKTAWQEAANANINALAQNPNDIYNRFNLSVAYYYLGQYQNSVNEFEKVEKSLPFRTLWYQIEPIQSYYQLGNYKRVFEITDNILNNGNRAFSELYIIRGDIYKKQGNIVAAKAEYEKAVFYNVNMKAAQDALKSVQ